MKKTLKLMALASVLVVMTGCASHNLSGTAYGTRDARTVQQVQFGVVRHVTPIVIENDANTRNMVGSSMGALVGGILGSKVGGGDGRKVATVVGGVVGGVAGSYAERSVTRRQGIEITVMLQNGRHISVVQQHGYQDIRVGDQVRVLGQGRNTRVTL